MGEVDRSAWDEFLAGRPEAHLLQTSAWGALKSAFGWRARRFIAGAGPEACGAQALIRRLPLGFSLAYIPKGPVGGLAGDPPGAVRADLLAEIDAALKKERAVLLKVEPDAWEPPPDSAAPGGFEPPPGFRRSAHEIQPARTLVVDLSGAEDEILMRMKQKTRYNIRLAQKKGVEVLDGAAYAAAGGDPLEAFNRLMAVTGRRDGFGVHSPEYYRRAYDLFHPGGACELLIAVQAARPLAALMAFTRGRRAWYFYGASADEGRDAMPTYLLQWEAMRRAKARGCVEYDLWGVPDCAEAQLEAGFTARSDGLWGVYRFKRGFGGELRRAPGPWDRVYLPPLYALYRLRAERSGS